MNKISSLADEGGDALQSQTVTRRRIVLLGATGSVGQSTLDLVERSPDKFEIVALTANRSAERLAELALKFRPELVVIADENARAELESRLAGSGITIAAGAAALIEAATMPADMVVAAIVGAAGLAPTLAAVEQGTAIALANKECLVCAGNLFMAAARKSSAPVIPVDSEHSAIMQSLPNGKCKADPGLVRDIVLTASGGPFRTTSIEDMRRATPEQALAHPVWSMGAKISIDSATMMNKALELIEAHHLFDVEADRLSALIHPQSIVHGFVRYIDGSVVAQLGTPDMRTPVAVALAWPERMYAPAEPLDLADLATLTFEKPQPERFPALSVVVDVMAKQDGSATIMNAANEVAVEAFLARGLLFGQIIEVVQGTLDQLAHRYSSPPQSLNEALEIDLEARRHATALIAR